MNTGEAISMCSRVAVFSGRPARLKAMYPIELTECGDSPIERRNATEFKRYFNDIWKELDVHVD